MQQLQRKQCTNPVLTWVLATCEGNEALVLDLIHRAAVDLGLKTERDHGNLPLG